MSENVYDLKSFYNGEDGALVRNILTDTILKFWPDCHDYNVLGMGYAAPYMNAFEPASRAACAMMAGQGAHHWSRTGRGERNASCLTEGSELPFENASIDRILIIHNLEYSEFMSDHMAEVWRVLKPNGRALFVVPNRAGFWARTDWAPFGHGRPFTRNQICRILRDNHFVYEQSRQALYLPPIRKALVRRMGEFFERYAPFIGLPGGVHMVEASKQLYAGADKGPGSRVMVRGRALFGQPAYQAVQNRNGD